MRSRLALGLVMVAMLMLPARGLGSMAIAQDDSTPTTGDVDELVVDGQRYSHDQAVPIDPAQMQERTDDSGAVIYVKPGDDPLGAVYLPHAGGAERYLPEHLDAPDTACPSEATNVGTIEGNGDTYIPSGLETDMPVDQLTQVGSTADGRTLYAPTADQPFEVLYASGADGGLVRYILMQQNGVPATFPDRLSFAGQVFQLTAGETPNAEGLQRAGCAARFPALVDGAEAGGPYSAVYVQIPNGYVVYRSIGPGVTATEPGIVPLETQAPPTAVPTEIPPTAIPTEIPTEIPTAIPTEAPPTAAPTEIPTEVPTAVPTEIPPTAVPTETPVPTAVPTEIPPTLAPTEVPPTAAPTETLVPTATVAPTTAPTQAPAQPTGTTAPAAAPTQAPPATTAPTEAPAATQTPTPRPTPTPKPLEPQALVPTLPPNAPPPAASTSTVTGCTGDPGTTGANGLPSRLPMSLQYGGTGYRYVETVPVSEIGDLTRIGCVGPFEAYRGADQDGSLFLTLANVAESAWRYERTSSFTVRTEVSDTPRSLTLQGTGDQPDVTYRASDPLVRSVYSSVTLILYVADAESTTPDRVLGYAVDRDVFGEYVPEGQGDPVSQDVQAQAEELGIHPRLTIGNSNQTYVLVALWRPFGTTTNGWLTLYGPEGEAAPDQLIGIDPRRLDLQIFNRAD